MAGVDIRDLQDWLGHENISSTNIYTRSDYQKQVRTGEIVMLLFGNVKENDEIGDKQKENIHIAVWMS